MKALTILAAILLLNSCCIFEPAEQTPAPPQRVKDTVEVVVFVADTATVDSLQNRVLLLQQQNDSLQVVTDTLATKLLRYKLVVEHVKYYVGICNRNPKQSKFLRGWINRAVKDY